MNETDSPHGQVLRDLMEATRRFNRLQFSRGPWAGGQHIRPNEWFLMGRLNRATAPEGIKPSELAAQLGVTPGSVTQLITSLEARGWVLRHIDAEDRRAVRVSLTETGREELDRVRSTFALAYAGLVDALGVSECRQLAALLHKASDYFESTVPITPCSKEEHHPC
jgi:DNA-binding MarR family transcriptional regulator